MRKWPCPRCFHLDRRLGYFVYCNGRTDLAAFDGKLEFDVTLIPYVGDDSWIEQAIRDAHACLNAPEIPAAAAGCDYCAYVAAVAEVQEKPGTQGGSSSPWSTAGPPS